VDLVAAASVVVVPAGAGKTGWGPPSIIFSLPNRG